METNTENTAKDPDSDLFAALKHAGSVLAQSGSFKLRASLELATAQLIAQRDKINFMGAQLNSTKSLVDMVSARWNVQLVEKQELLEELKEDLEARTEKTSSPSSTAGEPTGLLGKGIPDRIFLQYYGDGDPKDAIGEPEWSEVTYSRDTNVYDYDIEYKRVRENTEEKQIIEFLSSWANMISINAARYGEEKTHKANKQMDMLRKAAALIATK